jgi:hypothetical protein
MFSPQKTGSNALQKNYLCTTRQLLSMYVHTYTYGKIPIEMWEYPVYVFLLFLTFLIARNYVRSMALDEATKKYFIAGLFAKIVGGFMFACIYIFYYLQGDTTSFYECSLAFCKLFYTDLDAFFSVLLGNGTQEMKSYFTAETGEPMMYMFGEGSTRFVMKILIPFLLLSGQSYFIATALISIFSFGALWSLYKVFVSHFPNQSKPLAYAILFMPSVVFWGSGMLKDSFTLAATCYFIVFTHRIAHRIGSLRYNIPLLVVSAFFILSIKAYILLILIPSSLVWLLYHKIKGIRNPMLRFLLVPSIYAIIIVGSYAVFSSTGEYFGKFSLDRALKTAVITQTDLKQEYYQGNSFDIGVWDATLGGALSKFPQATIAGLFRPWLFESKNIVMLISGLENLVILSLSLYALVTLKIRRVRPLFSRYPILLYSIIFSIFFAFMIGLSTSNFGALVRFKIPLIPLYMSVTLLIIAANKGKTIDQAENH